MKDPLEPTIIVIFGITGDLAQRYLLPALYHLIKDGLLNDQTEIIGVTRQKLKAESVLDATKLCVMETNKVCDPAVLKKMRHQLEVYQMDLTKGEDYDHLREHLDKIETNRGVCMDRLLYLAVPPTVQGSIVNELGKHRLNKGCQHGKASTRLLVEKPFGYDLTSAHLLIDQIAEHFSEDQVFRIDHYLAKETVQNILTFRFQNSMFLPLWNNLFINHIEIVADEEIDIEGRATFYEQTGALRDLIQSHLLQLLAVVTMEQPERMNSREIHDAKLSLLQTVIPVPANKILEQTVRGQYEGYRKEVGNSDSFIETYAGVQLFIDNKRWQKVPIVLRTGKALKKKETYIVVSFASDDLPINHLRFSLQPDEGISIDVAVKRPGFDDVTEKTTMSFSYKKAFDDHGHPDAYERVLVDAIRGDRTLFATSDEVLAAWRIIEPVNEAWSKNDKGLEMYTRGSDGPLTNWHLIDQE